MIKLIALFGIAVFSPAFAQDTPPPDIAPPTPTPYHPEFLCPIPMVRFPAGSAVLSKREADRLADSMPDIQAHCVDSIVMGRVDSREHVADAEALARKRAGVVVDFLIKAGRDPKVIRVGPFIIGHELEDPFDPNAVEGVWVESHTGP